MMWQRVIGPIVFISLLWISTSTATTYYIQWLSASYDRVLSENVSTIQAVGRIQDVLWRLQAAVLDARPGEDPESRLEVGQLLTAFESQLGQVKRNATTAEEQVLVEAVEENFQLYRAHVVRRLAAPEDSADARPPSLERTARLALAVAEPCRQLMDVNERLLRESIGRNARYGSLIMLIRFSLLVVGPVLGVFLGIWTARRLNRSISQISITLDDAAGELEQDLGRVTVHPRGDLSGLQEQVQAVSNRIKQVLDQLQEARRETMRADRLAAVGQLAAGVAHELRNPLTSVKLLIQTAAQRQPARSLSEKQMHVVQQEIQRMESTIQRLLDFARPAQLRPVRHDLRDTVTRALNLVEGRAEQQGVKLVLHLPEEEVAIDADAEQLHQVFVNLSLNGIDSMEHGGTLSVSLEVAAGFTGHVRFADTGCGIPPAVLARIFEPFVTSKERGTGLGLAISRRIVQQHGGKLRARNAPGGGAEFAIELPLARPVVAPDEPAEPAVR
jgi:signal transduction histidine kinase